jgi:hypothetical protein
LPWTPTGTDIQGESARIRERGPVTLVELPGGVRAWSVTDVASFISNGHGKVPVYLEAAQ